MARSAATMRSRRASTDWSGGGIATDTQALLPGPRGGAITTPSFRSGYSHDAGNRAGPRKPARVTNPLSLWAVDTASHCRHSSSLGIAIASRLEPTCGIYEGRFFDAAPGRAWRQFKLIWLKRRKR